MKTIAQLAAGIAVLYAGIHMAVVMSPPDPAGWSVAAMLLTAIGAAIAGHAALDLLGVE